MTKLLLTLLVLALGLYLLLCGLLYVFQRNLLYLPSRETADLGVHPEAGLRALSVQGADGAILTHWYRPPATSEGPVVVVFHGNAGHIGHRVPKFDFLLAQGQGLLLVGYPGYGGNPGKPSQAALLEAGRTALTRLAEEGVPPERSVLYGESLGTAATTILAAEQAAQGQPFAGLVLEAPFTSIADVAAHHYWYVPARRLLRDPWRSDAVIGKIAAPLLVIHGKRDRTVPFVFGERLYDVAEYPKEALFLDDASHNDLYDDPSVPASVVAFVAKTQPNAPLD